MLFHNPQNSSTPWNIGNYHINFSTDKLRVKLRNEAPPGTKRRAPPYNQPQRK